MLFSSNHENFLNSNASTPHPQSTAAPANQVALAGEQRALLDSLPDVTWIKDAEGRLTAVNGAFATRYGITTAEAVGKTDFDIYPASKARQLLEEDNRIIATGVPVRYESMQVIGGRECWVEVVKGPVLNADGKVIGTVGTSRDISARKEAERLMLASEKRFRMLAELSSDWFWEQDSEFRFTWFSARRDIQFDLDLDQLIGKRRWEILSEGMTSGAWHSHRATLEAHLPFSDLRYVAVLRDGRRRHFSVSGRPLFGAGGRFSGYCGVGHDITDKVNSESELRIARERLDLALAGSRLALWDTDVALGKTYLSEGWAQCLGLPPGPTQTTTEALLSLVHPDDLATVHAAVNGIMRGAKPEYSAEHRVRATDGRYLWILSRGRVTARDATGRATRLSGTNLDITERKAMEGDLARARDAADAASQAKSAFLATISHEIRTPMSGVLGMLELLEHGNLTADQLDTVSLARESAQSLLRLINDVLDFSKIEAGQLEIAREPVSLPILASRAVTIFSELATRKGLRIEKRISPDLAPSHIADGFRVSQILNNMLSNAIKFTIEGAVTVTLEAVDRTEEAQTVLLRVSDTGIGIPPERQRQLFQPFIQADAGTTRQFGGTGLGLSICRNLAELMGGQITLESTVGNGTTATLSLRLPIAGPSADPALGRAPAASTADQHLVGTHVLVVEDHDVNLSLIKRQLGLLGCAPDIARDGLEALEKWKATRHALILTDCHMPQMDGYELARRVRDIEAAEHCINPTRIVACTAGALDTETPACRAVGMDEVLGKPISLHELKGVLAGSGARRPAVAPGTGVPPTPSPAASTVAAPPPPIDETLIEGFADGNPEIIRDILVQFLESHLEDLTQLRAAMEGTDSAATARCAHRALGASRMVGARDYATVVSRIEIAAKMRDRDEALSCLEQLNEQHQRLVGYLRARLAASPNP